MGRPAGYGRLFGYLTTSFQLYWLRKFEYMVTVTVNDKWERIRKDSIVAYYGVMASQIFWRNCAKQRT
jgi:hypothetical protein